MTTPDLLQRIVAAKLRAHSARQPRTLDSLWQEVAACPPARPWRGALRVAGTLQAIAEFKRQSPSAGAIRPGADPALIAAAYAAAGAAAMSVLTDEEFFDGRLADLGSARQACTLPVLRKDFLLDERDLVETRLAGADAALLIVRLFAASQLSALVAVGKQLGLGLLVEAHTDGEVEIALAAGSDVVGVNHRDLDTLKIDLELSARARRLAGEDIVLVAESGIATVEDMARMRRHRVDAVLVGESLLRAPSPGDKLSELLA